MPAPGDTGVSEPVCLANARLVLSDRVVVGAVTALDGRIVAITEGTQVPAGAEDLGGDYLIPGLVELHTDNLERHIEPRPKVHLPTNMAVLAHDGELAACGITTVFDALRIGSDAGEDAHYTAYGRKVASEILSLRDKNVLRIRHMLHLRAEVCCDSLIEELDSFGPDDRVRLISLMDHTPGERQFRDLGKLQNYTKMPDAEFRAHVAHRQALGDRVRDTHEAATVAAVKRLGATLASHDDTTVDHVAKSKRYGAGLAEFPTTREAAEACREAGISIIMGAPNIMRGGSHSGNVSALELAEADLLDVVSSDYVPSALLISAFKLAELWGDLPRGVRTVSETPAEATGLADRGRIAEGRVADLVRVSVQGDLPVVRAVWRDARRVG